MTVDLNPQPSAKKRSWLWLCLLMTLILVYWVNQSGDAPVSEDVLSVQMPSVRRASLRLPKPGLKVQESSGTQVSLIHPFVWQRGPLPAAATKPLFGMQSWEPPPQKPLPAPPPMAPVPPFTYLGSMEEMPAGRTVIFTQGKKVLIHALGSLITPQWRLDKEDAQAVYLTYLPLNQVKVLSKTNKPGLLGQPASVSQDNHSQEVTVQ